MINAMNANNKGTTTANILANDFNPAVYLLLIPIDWNEDEKPCHKWSANKKRKYIPQVLIGSANSSTVSW